MRNPDKKIFIPKCVTCSEPLPSCKCTHNDIKKSDNYLLEFEMDAIVNPYPSQAAKQALNKHYTGSEILAIGEEVPPALREADYNMYRAYAQKLKVGLLPDGSHVVLGLV